MDKRYFKIIPVTDADKERLRYILTSKTFFPEPTSNPPLPVKPVGSSDDVVFTANDTTNVLQATAHGLSNNTIVYLTSTGTLPDPLQENTAYYVVNATANDFKVSLTEGGAAIDLLDTGTGTHTYTTGFDYRQFFVFVAILPDGSGVVFTREQWTPTEFEEQAIPTADWTDRYGFSTAPTIEALVYSQVDKYGKDTNTGIYAFRSYDYNLFTNI